MLELVTKFNKANFFFLFWSIKLQTVSTVEQFSLCVRFVELMSNGEYKIVEQFIILYYNFQQVKT